MKRSETFEVKQSEIFFPEFREKEAKPSETVCVSLSFVLKQNFFRSDIGTPYLWLPVMCVGWGGRFGGFFPALWLMVNGHVCG